MQSSIALQDVSGLPFRLMLNEALQTLITQNAGLTEPNPTYAFQPWADTTTGILKQRNAANNEWIEILDLETGRPVGAVAQTSPTGALLLPEGTDAQRPLAADIPAGVAAVRGNSTSALDYFLELWDRPAGVWKALADRVWVVAKINELINGAIGFAIIYPNGGTAAAPANITVNSRYIEANPFPGNRVICRLEVLHPAAGWGEVSSAFGGTNATSFGAIAAQLNDSNEIIVQTATQALTAASANTVNPFGAVGQLATLPCRVKIWKIRGSVS